MWEDSLKSGHLMLEWPTRWEEEPSLGALIRRKINFNDVFASKRDYTIVSGTQSITEAPQDSASRNCGAGWASANAANGTFTSPEPFN